MPTRIGTGQLLDVWLAIRDHGVQTGTEISKRCGWPETQIGPLLYALMHMGAVRVISHGSTWRYVNARLAKWSDVQ